MNITSNTISHNQTHMSKSNNQNQQGQSYLEQYLQKRQDEKKVKNSYRKEENKESGKSRENQNVNIKFDELKDWDDVYNNENIKEKPIKDIKDEKKADYSYRIGKSTLNDVNLDEVNKNIDEFNKFLLDNKKNEDIKNYYDNVDPHMFYGKRLSGKLEVNIDNKEKDKDQMTINLNKYDNNLDKNDLDIDDLNEKDDNSYSINTSNFTNKQEMNNIDYSEIQQNRKFQPQAYSQSQSQVKKESKSIKKQSENQIKSIKEDKDEYNLTQKVKVKEKADFNNDDSLDRISNHENDFDMNLKYENEDSNDITNQLNLLEKEVKNDYKDFKPVQSGYNSGFISENKGLVDKKNSQQNVNSIVQQKKINSSSVSDLIVKEKEKVKKANKKYVMKTKEIKEEKEKLNLNNNILTMNNIKDYQNNIQQPIQPNQQNQISQLNNIQPSLIHTSYHMNLLPNSNSINTINTMNTLGMINPYLLNNLNNINPINQIYFPIQNNNQFSNNGFTSTNIKSLNDIQKEYLMTQNPHDLMNKIMNLNVEIPYQPIHNQVNVNVDNITKSNLEKEKSLPFSSHLNHIEEENNISKIGNYKPHTLKDYKENIEKLKKSEQYKGLGPNIGTKEWKEKKEKIEKAKEYSKSVKAKEKEKEKKPPINEEDLIERKEVNKNTTKTDIPLVNKSEYEDDDEKEIENEINGKVNRKENKIMIKDKPKSTNNILHLNKKNTNTKSKIIRPYSSNKSNPIKVLPKVIRTDTNNNHLKATQQKEKEIVNEDSLEIEEKEVKMIGNLNKLREEYEKDNKKYKGIDESMKMNKNNDNSINVSVYSSKYSQFNSNYKNFVNESNMNTQSINQSFHESKKRILNRNDKLKPLNTQKSISKSRINVNTHGINKNKTFILKDNENELFLNPEIENLISNNVYLNSKIDKIRDFINRNEGR